MNGSELAVALDLHQGYMERVLRVAERLQLLKITEIPNKSDPLGAPTRVYELTQLSAVLCEDHPNSVKYMVQLMGDHFQPAGCLGEGVRTGKTPYMLWAHGQTHWQHMTAEPELYERFNR